MENKFLELMSQQYMEIEKAHLVKEKILRIINSKTLFKLLSFKVKCIILQAS